MEAWATLQASSSPGHHPKRVDISSERAMTIACDLRSGMVSFRQHMPRCKWQHMPHLPTPHPLLSAAIRNQETCKLAASHSWHVLCSMLWGVIPRGLHRRAYRGKEVCMFAEALCRRVRGTLGPYPGLPTQSLLQ